MKKILIFFVALFVFACNQTAENNSEEKVQKKSKEQVQNESEETNDIALNTVSEVGDQVQNFSFTTLDGTTHNINDFMGKYVFMNFFATSCPICMKEMPHLEEEIWQQYKEKEFVVISFGREHTMEEVKEFQEKKGYTFLMAPDPDREIYHHFAKKYIPRNVLLNKEGIIVHQDVGYSEESFDKFIEILDKEL